MLIAFIDIINKSTTVRVIIVKYVSYGMRGRVLSEFTNSDTILYVAYATNASECSCLSTISHLWQVNRRKNLRRSGQNLYPI